MSLTLSWCQEIEVYSIKFESEFPLQVKKMGVWVCPARFLCRHICKTELYFLSDFHNIPNVLHTITLSFTLQLGLDLQVSKLHGIIFTQKLKIQASNKVLVCFKTLNQHPQDFPTCNQFLFRGMPLNCIERALSIYSVNQEWMAIVLGTNDWVWWVGISTTPWYVLLILLCNPTFWLAKSISLIFKHAINHWFWLAESISLIFKQCNKSPGFALSDCQHSLEIGEIHICNSLNISSLCCINTA